MTREGAKMRAVTAADCVVIDHVKTARSAPFFHARGTVMEPASAVQSSIARAGRGEADLQALREVASLATKHLEDTLDRARLLVRDAVARLLASFSALGSVVSQQRDLLLEVLGEIHSEGGHGFAETTIQLLNEFVSQVVRVSQESMRTIERLEDTSQHVDAIVHHAGHIDRLARETRFIALNARIETQRMSAGATFAVVADEVKRLAVASAELSVKIRGEVAACHERLGQAHAAASALAGHDMTSAIDSHERVIGLIKKLDGTNRTMTSTLQSVDAGIAEAVRALQFEDMVSQLLVDATRRVKKLGSLLVDAAARVMAGSGDLDDVCEAIRELGRPASVEQTSMDQGSVELF